MDYRSNDDLVMPPPPPCGHGWEMMEAMRRQQELVMQLRALVLPLLVHGAMDGGGGGAPSAADIAVQLFDDVIGCNIGVVSTLEGCILSTGGGGPSVESVDDKSLVMRNNSAPASNNGEKAEKQARLAANSKQHQQPNGVVVGQKRRCVWFGSRRCDQQLVLLTFMCIN